LSSEADLEDVLLLLLKLENYVATFLGDSRSGFCVDLPAARLQAAAARHTLLRHLACLAPVNTRRHRYCLAKQCRSSPKTRLAHDKPPPEPSIVGPLQLSNVRLPNALNTALFYFTCLTMTNDRYG
jgi:hypothetical protein